MNSKQAMLDALRGGLMGATVDSVGGTVDAVANFMRPMGYNVPAQNVVGGSDWLANRLTTPTNSSAENAGRMVGGMLSPSPMKRVPIAEMAQRPKYGSAGHLIDKYSALTRKAEPKTKYGSAGQLIDKYRALAGAKFADTVAARKGSFLSSGERFNPPDEDATNFLRSELADERRTRAVVEQLRAGGKPAPNPVGYRNLSYGADIGDLRATPPARAGVDVTPDETRAALNQSKRDTNPTSYYNRRINTPEEQRAIDAAEEARIRKNANLQTQRSRARKKTSLNEGDN
jgi:hypothetical protein